jgi:hypothetical protein
MAGDVEGGEGLDRRYVVVDETSSIITRTTADGEEWWAGPVIT